ncbi:MAG: phenylalanine--tRNA ligase subunit alpha [Limnochordia bacterium]|jgi:phenylalanyl-tRNA synthetase alpha chain
MERQIKQLQQEALQECRDAATKEALENVRIKYLGRKGQLTQLLRGMGQLSPEERPRIGGLVNRARDVLEGALAQRAEELGQAEEARRLKEEALDITLPGRRRVSGHKHPLTQVMEEIIRIFSGMGFQVAQGPEVETDYYNFEALNVPKHHPARDMQDTFYITEELLLRTQTSPVQIRVMEKQSPPVRIIAPGKVYRVDVVDVTHSPMFHQVEGLVVDEQITFGDLKGVLAVFVEEMFGKGTGVRFRPSYFPFTEPSAEVDISCVMCHGSGCRVCSQSGWLEILGSGMVHPRVLEAAGYDPEKVGGFAFGMGVERIAMLKYGIDDIRLFFENDYRFLGQF